MTALERVPGTSLAVTATTDGSVAAWCLTTLEPKFRMRAQNGVAGLRLTGSRGFALFNGAEVFAVQLRHCFSTFAECSTPPVALEAVAPGVVMITCAVRSPASDVTAPNKKHPPDGLRSWTLS